MKFGASYRYSWGPACVPIQNRSLFYVEGKERDGVNIDLFRAVAVGRCNHGNYNTVPFGGGRFSVGRPGVV